MPAAASHPDDGEQSADDVLQTTSSTPAERVRAGMFTDAGPSSGRRPAVSSGGHSSERLPPVLAALRRKWLIVVIVVLVVTAGSLVVSLRTSPVYRSTAKVLIADRDLAGAVAGVPESALSSANLATEAQIASLPTVLQQPRPHSGTRTRTSPGTPASP
jgi:hypothetical protein